jgi:hypothetical protein
VRVAVNVFVEGIVVCVRVGVNGRGVFVAVAGAGVPVMVGGKGVT